MRVGYINIIEKCEFCRLNNMDCRESRCVIEYAKLIIIASMINELLYSRGRIRIPLMYINGDLNLSSGDLITIKRELTNARRNKTLHRLLTDYLKFIS